MMNMMNRMVEGRGHKREIDMLLELTCVILSSVICFHSNRLVANKWKGVPSVRLVTLQLGRFKALCAISAQKLKSEFRHIEKLMDPSCLVESWRVKLIQIMLSPIISEPTSRKLLPLLRDVEFNRHIAQ